jgi:hypothetical protein
VAITNDNRYRTLIVAVFVSTQYSGTRSRKEWATSTQLIETKTNTKRRAGSDEKFRWDVLGGCIKKKVEQVGGCHSRGRGGGGIQCESLSLNPTHSDSLLILLIPHHSVCLPH